MSKAAERPRSEPQASGGSAGKAAERPRSEPQASEGSAGKAAERPRSEPQASGGSAGKAAEGPLVIAHRGASAYRPENTLAAYALAVEQGADMIEIDLHRTRDEAIVITHDELLGGLGGVGEVADATLADVLHLDAGGGERVPTLDAVLDGFGERIPFNLELKRGTRGPYAGLEAAALAAVERRGLLGRTLFSSFFDPVLRELRRLSPAARIGFLVSRRYPERALERAAAVGAEALHPEVSLVTRSLVDDAHAAGLAVYVFTVDDPGEMDRLLDMGVDGLFSNVPDRLRSVVERRMAQAGV